MNRIRQIRETQGISQKELARRANICQGLLCNLEKERIKPWPSALRKLSKALKVKPEELYPAENENIAVSVTAPAILSDNCTAGSNPDAM